MTSTEEERRIRAAAYLREWRLRPENRDRLARDRRRRYQEDEKFREDKKRLQREYTSRHRDAINSNAREYYLGHRESINSKIREQRRTNPETTRARDRQNYLRNIDEKRKAGRKDYQKNLFARREAALEYYYSERERILTRMEEYRRHNPSMVARNRARSWRALRERNAFSATKAIRHGAPWTAADDTALLALSHLTDMEKALALGRTVASVKKRKL